MGPKRRPYPLRLAEKLIQIRIRLGLSQNEMLRRLALGEQYDRTTISNYERGNREPPLPALLRYARIAGVSMDVIVDDELDLPVTLPAKRQRS